MSKLALSATGAEPTTAFIESIVPTDAGLDVVFAGSDSPVTFTWFWLRDHGVDDASLDPRTLQRRVDTFSIPADIAPMHVRIDDDLDEDRYRLGRRPADNDNGACARECAGTHTGKPRTCVDARSGFVGQRLAVAEPADGCFQCDHAR